MKLQQWVLTPFLLGLLTGCYDPAKHPLVSIKVFEDYVTIDGVRSEVSIQEAADSQLQSRQALLMLMPAEPLSATRQAELQHSLEKIYPSAGVGVRKVVFPCQNTASTQCP